MVYKVCDIINYERNNNISILKELCNLSICTLADMVMIGANVDMDDAYNIIDCMFEDQGIERTFINICYDIIGINSENEETSNSNVENNSLTEIFEHIYFEIKKYDNTITLSEYMNMDTRYVFKYCEQLKDKIIDDFNNRSADNFRQATTLLGVLFGKLNKPIKIENENNVLSTEDVKNKLRSSGHHVFD